MSLVSPQTILKPFGRAARSQPRDVNRARRTEISRGANGSTTDRYRRGRFWRPCRRQGSQENTRGGDPNRPLQPPPVSAAALSGGNSSADSEPDRDTHTKYSSQS